MKMQDIRSPQLKSGFGRSAAMSKCAQHGGHPPTAVAERSFRVAAETVGSEAGNRPATDAAVVAAAPCPAANCATERPMIFLLANDSRLSDTIGNVLAGDGCTVEVYRSRDAFLTKYRPRGEACLVVDAHLSFMSGLGLLRWTKRASHAPPAIAIVRHGDVEMAVRAMQAGAVDCLERPCKVDFLVASVERALVRSRELNESLARQSAIAERFAALTERERQIMELVLAGHPNKNIAADLGVSQRTVESHRASIMKKTGAKSLPALVRLTLATVAMGASPAETGAIPSRSPDESFAPDLPAADAAPRLWRSFIQPEPSIPTPTDRNNQGATRRPDSAW